MKKNLFWIVLLIGFGIVVCVCPVRALASPQGEIVSHEEYISAIVQELDKDGGTTRVVYDDNSSLITQDMLEESLNVIRKAAAERSFAEMESATSLSVPTEPSVLRRAPMIVTQNFDYTENQYFGPGMAGLTLRVNGTYDAQYGSTISLNSVTSCHSGTSINYAGWTQLGASGSRSSKSFFGTANGIMSFAWTEPNTGIQIEHSTERSISHTWYL